MTTLYATGHNRHAIRKHKDAYAVVFHGALTIDYLYTGSKEECQIWLKEQIKLLKASK